MYQAENKGLAATPERGLGQRPGGVRGSAPRRKFCDLNAI